MVLDKLGGGLQGLIERVRGSGVVDKKLVKEITKELQKTLISADVNIKQVFEISKRIEEKALSEQLPGGINRKEHLVKVLYFEISELMGGEGQKLELDAKKQNRILMVGIQGSGKTTTCAKLSKYGQKRGLKPALICADTFRPGALAQLQQLGKEVNVSVYGEEKTKDFLGIVKRGLEKFKDYNLVIIDSEGRHSLDEQLMEDIGKLEKTLQPKYTLLVLDATIGQQAQHQAEAFKEKCNVNGIILTKVDGSAKGGGSISACAAAGAPVYLIGTGERVSELEEFESARFVGRLMGFGDVKGLVQKFEEHVEKDKAEEAAKRMMSGKFTLLDVYDQLEQLQKMGSMDKLLEMMPMGQKVPKDLMKVQEDKLKKFRPILDSMTKEELENPKLNRARIERIAKGSGTTPEDVRALIQQYNQMRGMFKKVTKDRKFARMFKGMVGM